MIENYKKIKIQDPKEQLIEISINQKYQRSHKTILQKNLPLDCNRSKEITRT